VVDSGGLSASGLINIFVVDTNDAPVVTPASFSVHENSPAGRVVGTVVAVDPDNLRAGVQAQVLTFRISSGDNDRRFSIHPTSGVITVAKPALDFETASLYDLTVEATDDAPGGQALSGYAVVAIRILDVNEAPQLGAQFLTVTENCAVGTSAVSSVSLGTGAPGVDVDAGDTLSYVDRHLQWSLHEVVFAAFPCPGAAARLTRAAFTNRPPSPPPLTCVLP
jgi:hypothetical protein